MSSAGQIVGGLIGGVVGTFTPAGTFLGAQLGMMLGGYIDPGKGTVEEGPRLSDLTVQTSTYGAVIPDIYGTDAVSGNVFWLQGNKIDETPVKKKTGGKGGQKKATVTWVNTATFAIGLCKGPIAGVRRIWLGGELYYDAGSTDHGTIAASNAAAEGFKVYLGTDTQGADPRIQADLGVANTPAWRGRAYIVFYDLDLAKYSGSLVGVQAKVEVVQTGTVAEYRVVPQTMASAHTWYATAWNGSVFCSVAFGSAVCATSPDGVTWTDHALPVSDNWQDIASNGSLFVVVGSTDKCYTSPDGINWTARNLPSSGYTTQVKWNGAMFLAIRENNPFVSSFDGITWIERAAPDSGYYGNSLAWNGSVWVTVKHFGSADFLSSPDGIVWTSRLVPTGNGWASIATNGGRFCLTSTNWPGSYTSDDGITWTYYNAAGALPGGGGGVNSIASDGSVFIATTQDDCYLSADGQVWEVLATPDPGGVAWEGITWSGAVFSVVSDDGARALTIQPHMIAAATTLLGDIVSAECLQSGLLTSGDIDVSQLTDLVRGYTDSSTGSIRDSLSPLQTAWPFDVRQRGYKLEFVRRGGASIRTIDANDLDARGSSTSPGVKITQAREMNLQLPRSVIVNHKDYDREYAVGEQYAERLSTDAVNEVAYELPIVMTASEAAQKADILLYLAWMERVDLSFSLPNTYLNLEPGDVLSLPVNGSLASIRVVSMTYTSDGRIDITGKFASASIYVSSAVGVSPLVMAQTTISLPGASSYELMDLPVLHATQLDPSFLAAMYGPTGWIGGVLLRSDDSGTTWADLQAFSSPGGTVGSATSVIGVVDSRVWDNASVLSVGMANGDLFSVTAEAVLNGANYFAYGADGRWEVIAVQTCTLVSADTYRLTSLLRGRFGTEWAMPLHVVGDKVVLLNTSDVAAIGVSINVLGLERVYRGVTLDQDISSAADVPFSYKGANLKPLSPARCSFYKDASSNNCIGNVTRRTRYGGEWADNTDALLSETTEAYEIDMFTDVSYTIAVRTIASSSPAVTYTAEQQVSDFGTYPDTVYYKAYQMSSVIGRGYPFVGQADVAVSSEYSVQVTVPSSSVTSNLVNYPLFIDLSLMSTAFWESLAYKDGRDIRATNAIGAQIPVDVVYVDSVNETGYIFVKTNLSSSTDTIINVNCGLISDGYVAPSDPNGRMAVWSNYASVHTFGTDHVNRASTSYATANVATTSMQLQSTSPNVFSHQGVAWDGAHYYVSSTNTLTKYTAGWAVVTTNTNPVGDVGFGTNHVGDIEVINGIIYAPVENYVSISVFSAQRIARFSASTLAYIDSVSISAQGHEASSLAYCPIDGLLYVSSYADGSKLWKYNPLTMGYVGSMSLSSTLTRVQGVTYWQGAFWVNSGDTKKTFRVEYGGTVRGSVYEAVEADAEYEGIGHTDSGLIVLVDSIASPNNGVIRSLTPEVVGKTGAVKFVSPLNQFEYCEPLARSTSWTMGATINMTSNTASMGVMSYTLNGSTANADRATVAYRLTSDKIGLWNSTDLWLLDTLTPVVGTTYRLNASHNGTSGRKLYRDGAVVASSGSCAARPAIGADAFVMGIESWQAAEDYDGLIGYAYLALSSFSDDYVAAESANLTSPETFYSLIG